MPVVVSRLINARRHWLALQISTVLGMGPEKVGAHAYLLRYAKGPMEGNALQRRVRDVGGVPEVRIGHAGRYTVLIIPAILLLLSEAGLGLCQSFWKAVS